MSDFVNELLNNKVLLIAAVSWLTAGVIKTVIELVVHKKLLVSRVFGAGGMPSSHTSTVIALAISTAYYAGVGSTSFAIAVIFAIVVIHDAIGVRQETGKQAKVLNAMMFESNAFDDLDFEKKLKEYIGHTPFQVLVGGIVGAIVATIMVNYL